jgi:hypothetical protein
MRHFIIYLFVLLLGLTGCSDNLLNKVPVDKLSPSTFYKNESEVDMGLMGIYSSFETPWWHAYEFMSDNGYCHHSWQGSLEFGAWLQTSTSERAYEKWTVAYRTIARINMFLENIENAPISEDVKREKSAEARFIRAYFYTDLVHYYGDVPLILSTLSLEEAKVKRTPKKEVLKAATEDFDYAITNLPMEQEEVGRVTRGAALAFKARMFLYNEEWDSAAETAKAVIDLGKYKLIDDYASIFEENNENNEEVIFDLQYMPNLRPQPWPSTSLSYSEWPTAGVTLSLIDDYYMINGKPITDPDSGYDEQKAMEGRDPRMAATLVLPGSMFGTYTYIPANLDVEVQTCFRPRKYADINSTDRYNCGINIILMRYADVLLMRAEALIESGDISQEVYDLINLVRQRKSVGMPKIEDVEGIGLSQAELRQIVRHERRVEFAFEFTRYSDMRRWQLKEAVHDVWGFDKQKLKNPANPLEWVFERVKLASRSFNERKGWLWPIPLEELQNNSNLVQNPGY